ncbi:hypothetical protein PTMSG1_05520 [Pyrenophora teres f. maculata]|nr:hypothetical protein PTMSG1_05520 [Pyrenophora teres f. maculata]
MRLASRRMHEATTKAFARAIEDFPTKCLPQSLQKLSSLVGLPFVGHRIKSLGFETARMYIDDDFGPLRETNPRRAPALKHRNQWLTEKYAAELLWVFIRTPGLKQLTVIPDQVVPVELPVGDDLAMGFLMDPFECLEQALQASDIHKQLLTLKVLSSRPRNGYRTLKILSKQIRSLFHSSSSSQTHDMESRKPSYMTVSAYGADVDYRDLYKTLVELGDGRSVAVAVDRLTIRGLSIHKATTWVRRPLPQNIHFGEIVFEYVFLCSENRTISLFARWRALPVFAVRADAIKLVNDGQERVLQQNDMFQEDDDEMAVDDFYEDDMEDELYDSEDEDDDLDLV